MKDTMRVLEAYKTKERAEHINEDDILNKITQEVVELLEGVRNNDIENIYEEAGDILINVISFASELGIDVSDLIQQEKDWSQELLDLFGRWNEQVQGLRGKYSRKQKDFPEVESLTKSFISTVLNYTKPENSIHDTLENNLSKLTAREGMYKPDINVKDYIAEYQDFPKEWINFKDVLPLGKNLDAFEFVCCEMAEKCRWAEVLVALDARGFLFAPGIAKILGIDWIAARKPWKLPWEVVSISYELEYGSNTIEMQKYDADGGLNIAPEQKVAIVDDLLATWGTAMAAIKLVEELWWIVHHAAFVVWLDEEFLLGQETRKQLQKYPHSAVVSYD